MTRFRREVPSLPLSTLCRAGGGGVCIERVINIAGQKNAAAPLELPPIGTTCVCGEEGRKEGLGRRIEEGFKEGLRSVGEELCPFVPP